MSDRPPSWNRNLLHLQCRYLARFLSLDKARGTGRIRLERQIHPRPLTREQLGQTPVEACT